MSRVVLLLLFERSCRGDGWLLGGRGGRIAPSVPGREGPRLGRRGFSCMTLRRLCARAKDLGGRLRVGLFWRCCWIPGTRGLLFVVG